VRHRRGHGIEKGGPLLLVLCALERIALGLIGKPELLEREPPRIGRDNARRRSVTANHDMIDWPPRQQPFLFRQRHGPRLVEARQRFCP
jgi:hypothetical protein